MSDSFQPDAAEELAPENTSFKMELDREGDVSGQLEKAEGEAKGEDDDESSEIEFEFETLQAANDAYIKVYKDYTDLATFVNKKDEVISHLQTEIVNLKNQLTQANSHIESLKKGKQKAKTGGKVIEAVAGEPVFKVTGAAIIHLAKKVRVIISPDHVVHLERDDKEAIKYYEDKIKETLQSMGRINSYSKLLIKSQKSLDAGSPGIVQKKFSSRHGQRMVYNSLTLTDSKKQKSSKRKGSQDSTSHKRSRKDDSDESVND